MKYMASWATPPPIARFPGGSRHLSGPEPAFALAAGVPTKAGLPRRRAPRGQRARALGSRSSVEISVRLFSENQSSAPSRRTMSGPSLPTTKLSGTPVVP